MEMLLDAGANPNATRPRRGTALRICVEKNDIPSVRLLVARGADPSLEGPIFHDGTQGPSALELARRKDRKEILAILTGTPFVFANNGRERILQLIEDASFDETNYRLRSGASPQLVDEFLTAVDVDIPKLLLDMYWRADGQDPI